ncbi:MAG: SDR family NAD(P)-dependent oxidoreductase [Crocinitomix sp.]|nr:SDR family NAD(P)-dependent oxidoreductase [Crocinitomix sp.]
MRFKNKVGIITGSSRGIGRATAIELCQQGAKIVLNGRSHVQLLKTRDELLAMGFEVIALQGDVTSMADCEYVVAETIKVFGQLDFLINNGSSTMNESFENIEPAIYQNVLCSNALGAVLPTMAALPYLKQSKGSILFISSLAGLHGMPSASAYSSGKMALTALWQSLKIELSHTGIHFGICYLGFTENDAEKKMLTADGTLIPVPNRPAYLVKSQKQVAQLIAKSIYYRKSRRVISFVGKLAAFLFRFFPKLALLIMIKSQQRGAEKIQSTQAVLEMSKRKIKTA